MKFRFAVTKQHIFFAAVTLVMAAMVWYSLHSGIDYSPYYSPSVSFPIGKVVEVVEDLTEIDVYGLHRGRQELRVELVSGERRGEVLAITNTLTIDHNVYVRPGQRIVVYYDRQPGDDYVFASVHAYERSRAIYLVLALFLCLLAGVGGRTGLRSAFGLVFAFVAILFFLIPRIIQGVPPAPLSLGTALCVAAVSLISILGFTKKAVVGMLGTAVGVTLCCVFYALVGSALRVTGYSVPEIDSLMVIAYNTDIKVGEFLFCGVLVSSLGAVIDVAVSVASSVAELHEANPSTGFDGLFRSGLRIGRDIVSATANTLILAFAGAFFTTLIVLRVYEVQFNRLINLNDVAIELLQAVSASSALILCAPATAFLAARIYGGGTGRRG